MNRFRCSIKNETKCINLKIQTALLIVFYTYMITGMSDHYWTCNPQMSHSTQWTVMEKPYRESFQATESKQITTRQWNYTGPNSSCYQFSIMF